VAERTGFARAVLLKRVKSRGSCQAVTGALTPYETVGNRVAGSGFPAWNGSRLVFWTFAGAARLGVRQPLTSLKLPPFAPSSDLWAKAVAVLLHSKARTQGPRGAGRV